MWKSSERKWIADFVANVRDARRCQGHELRALQQGIVEAVAARDPQHEPASKKELEEINVALREQKRWVNQEEWRIMTWFDLEIATTTRNDAQVYEVTVECDGQRLSCACPTVEGAYAYMNLYKAMIVDQFYTIGPPWANSEIYKA